jgi:hypothetical protein
VIFSDLPNPVATVGILITMAAPSMLCLLPRDCLELAVRALVALPRPHGRWPAPAGRYRAPPPS